MAMEKSHPAIPLPLAYAFALIGLIFVALKVFSYVRLLLNAFVLSGTNTEFMSSKLRKYGSQGSWAVVTGASDGLGKEYAQQLAAKGFNIVLVSRTLSKLEILAEAIQERYAGVKTRVLAMDYSENDDADYVKLAELLHGLDVAILINNVGQSHEIPVPFLETDKEELEAIVTINCIGTLKTTQVVAPLMVQRKRGLILTMGSFGGWMPTPYLATYSGSKAFLQHWSAALAEELKSSHVDVQLVLSYLVISAMSKVKRPSVMIPLPRPFVKAALGKVGLGGTQAIASTYTPYWSHALMQWWVENTIGFGHWLGIKMNLDMHKDIRRRALRKAAREEKKS